MRPTLILPLSLCTAGLLAQEPILHASEVAAYEKVRHLLKEPAGLATSHASVQVGYELFAIGEDRMGRPFQGKTDGIDPARTSVLFLQPIRDSLYPARLMFANRAGRIFLGRPPAGADASWRPTVASIAAPRARKHVNDMLLQSGTAQDGTTWERIEALEGDIARELTVRVIHTDGSNVDSALVEIGSTRLPWHPAWLPVGHLPVVAVQANATPANIAGQGIAKVRGIPARDLRLRVVEQGDVVLRPDDVTFADGELRIRVDRAAIAPKVRLDDQAWAAQALRFLAADELAARKNGRIDADRDGLGEFGQPDDVVAPARRNYQRAGKERYLFRSHLFEVHVPKDADGAEQRFVAYAWPETAHGAHALAFFVDERGVVHSCLAHERFHGHDKAPAADAKADAALDWQPLR